jgi:hypothetical protein
MKNRFKIILLIFLPLIFVSCMDYVQSISYKDGKYHLYYKITVSKVMLAMANQKPDDLFGDFDQVQSDELPKSIRVKKVDTDLEAGYEFYLEVNPKTADEKEKQFLLKKKDNKYFVPFLLGQNERNLSGPGKSQYDEMSDAILSSAKCRILISKKIIPSVKEAYFEGINSDDYSIPFFDYGDEYCIEIPFIVVLKDYLYKTNRVVIIKK